MPRALILLYHRVAEPPSDPFGLCVRPDFFAQHLEVLRKTARPLPLQELTTALAQGRVPRRAVVVTFDDGYADNLHRAKPLCERFDVPATVFVASGYIREEREFWWDELERLLLQSGTLADPVRLSVDAWTFQWSLGAAACYDQASAKRYSDWRFRQGADPTERHRLFRALYPRLRMLAEADQRRVLEELRADGDVDREVRPTHRPLSLDELRWLADGIVDVGVHTVTHQVLAALPAAAQRREILDAKADLEAWLGRRMTAFAYPYGARADYTAQTIALVREAGFASACAGHAAAVSRRSDPFALPRVVVPDIDGDGFARHLDAWFSA